MATIAEIGREFTETAGNRRGRERSNWLKACIWDRMIELNDHNPTHRKIVADIASHVGRWLTGEKDLANITTEMIRGAHYAEIQRHDEMLSDP